MKRRIMANQVAEQLFETEAAIDHALGKIAGLAGLLPTARMEANISAVVGQAAFESIARSLTALTDARREIVDTHRNLTEMKDQVGLRQVSFGDTLKPPPTDRPIGFVTVEGRKAS